MPPKKSVVSALRMRKPSKAAPDLASMEAFVSTGSAAPVLRTPAPGTARVAIVSSQAVNALPVATASDFVCIALDEAIKHHIPHVSADVGMLAPETESSTPVPTSEVVPSSPRTRKRRARKSREKPAAATAARPPDPMADVPSPPTTAAEWVTQALEHLASGDVISALLGFGKAIRLDPGHATAYAHRAIARERVGNLAGAVADYDDALRLNPQLADAFYNRGNAYKAMGQLARAVDDYDEAIRLDPQSPLFFNNRGNVRFERNDLRGALCDYDAAIELDPNNAMAFHNRGSVRCSLGDVRGAIDDFRKYLDLGGGLADGDQAEVEQLIGELESELAQTG